MLGKACGIRVFEDVGAVAVIVAVGNTATNLMQASSPFQLSQHRFRMGCRELNEKAACGASDTLGVGRIYRKALDQPLHGSGTQVCFWLLAIQQVIQRTLA